ncbi:MAG: flagellar motor switch protein FliG, partial [Bryobacteraceae bacterium]
AMMPGIRKAAILVVVLGEQTAGPILRDLEDDEAASLSQEIARLPTVTPELAEAVLDDAYQMALAHDYVLKGGLDYARKLLMNAYGPERAKRLLDHIMKSMGGEAATFDALQKADPQQLAKFIHSEHPQTIALVLSHLNPSQAAGLLFSLPVEMRGEVALRMAHLDQISPDIITRIAAIIGQKLRALGEFSRESYGGVKAVSEMFNRLDSGTSKEILEDIEKTDPALVESIRHLMFVFEDLLLVDAAAIKEVLSRVDRKVLTVALKGTSDQLKQHFLSNMSQRGSEMMREDMDALGPVKIKEVEAAQQQIIAVVRQLEAEGVVSLKGTVGEQYVV